MDYLTDEQIQQLFNSTKPIKSKSNLYKILLQQTKHLPEYFLPKQRLWHLFHKTDTIPKCKMCSNPVKWDSTVKIQFQTYRTYCSRKCEHADPEVRNRKNNTEIQKYGKGKPEIVKKVQQTNNKKYGANYFIQTQQGKQKQKNTVLQKYGVENVSQIPKIIDKREKTNIKKFGVRAFSQQHLNKNVLDKINNKFWLYTKHIVNQQSITAIAKQLNINYEIITRHLKYHQIPITYFPFSSSLEQEIYQFISNICSNNNLTVQRNNTTILKPKHIDIYIPELRLGIEVNGLFWHSELIRPYKLYHFEKQNLAEQQGIKLIQLFESDWINNQQIIKSILNYHTKNCKNKIYARQCEIRELTNQDVYQFLQENHIQGYIFNKINLGLFFENQLISTMCFSKPRFNNNFQYELTRFCTKCNTVVIGGATKLFNYFIKKFYPKTIISYNDRRFGTGNLYKHLGFKFSHTTKPNYWYFKNGQTKLYSRINFQKHKLSKILETYSPELTEWENMRNNGYNRIWDCGNNVWVYHVDI